jgi:ParB family chromosome partitioning protein
MEKRLGKGLDALITSTPNKNKKNVAKIKLKDIVPNPFQPRKIFKKDKMEELISSIREKGVIQPVLVRPAGSGFELIAGERRFRAAQELDIDEVPAIIKEIDEASSLEISLIENIQREDLNPIEEAKAYQQLIGKFSYTLDKVGLMMGKDKSTISNSLRLLTLEEEIQDFLEQGKISTGHAKILLSIPSPHKRKRMVQTVMEHSLSVRQIEELVKKDTPPQKKTRKNSEPEIVKIEETLQHHLGTKVTIKQGKKRGKILIQYYSPEDLERVLGILLK